MSKEDERNRRSKIDLDTTSIYGYEETYKYRYVVNAYGNDINIFILIFITIKLTLYAISKSTIEKK